MQVGELIVRFRVVDRVTSLFFLSVPFVSILPPPVGSPVLLFPRVLLFPLSLVFPFIFSLRFPFPFCFLVPFRFPSASCLRPLLFPFRLFPSPSLREGFGSVNVRAFA